MGEKQRLVIDTNQWIDLNIEDLKQLTNDYDMHIPMIVVEELDHLKCSQNSQTAYDARKAIRFIYNNYDKFKFIECNDDIVENDNKIINVAKNYGCIMCSGDLNMKIKCRGLKIPIIEFENEKNEYKGYKVIELDINNNEDNQILADIYEQTSKNLWNLYVNQYLIIKDKNNKNTIDMLRWDGQDLSKLKLPPKKVIEPFNDLQTCALDLLHNKNIPIKILCGNLGSGKTHLATKLGLYYTLEKGIYNKVLCCRNPMGSGQDIGYLPGDKGDKVDDFYTPIKQNSSVLSINNLIECGQLEFEIPFYIKGNTYDDTWMIVDESEDFDVATFKITGGRIGKNSCITFCGDYLQTESKFKNNNGLKHAINKLKGDPLVGIVFLEDNVRSDASSVFLKL